MPFRAEEPKRRAPYSFVVASLLCLPAGVVIILFLVLLMCQKLLPSAPFSMMADTIGLPVLFAYYVLPSIIGIFYLGAAQLSLFAAWNKILFRSRLAIALGCYNFVILLCIGYDIWWFVTAQKFDYL
jgi:hypothetical protein